MNGLRSPLDRCRNDPQFAALVNVMEMYIHQAQFTPSEIREAAIVASIKVEMMNINRQVIIPAEAATAIKTLEQYMRSDPRKTYPEADFND